MTKEQARRTKIRLLALRKLKENMNPYNLNKDKARHSVREKEAPLNKIIYPRGTLTE
jgi:hypothetical protein